MRKYRLEITEKRTKIVEVEGLSYKEVVAKANEMLNNDEIDFDDIEDENLSIEGEFHIFEIDN